MSNVREFRRIRLPGGFLEVGGLAGLPTLHNFTPDGHTGSMCMACFGWVSDPRHAFHRRLPVGGLP